MANENAVTEAVQAAETVQAAAAAQATRDELAVEIAGLSRRFGRTEAVRDLNLSARPGRCYGFFGRNGAGKTTTIKCLLGHLRPTAGKTRIFGLDPRRNEVALKQRIGYVPETVGFYPWMTAQGLFDYAASFRPKQWNRGLERSLMSRFGLDPKKKIKDMSKGMRAQLTLICAIAAEPDLLLLDEPTSGLDPIVRREFIQTVIGAYQEGAPERRTVFVSTHLIGEWEGMIDEFTIIDQGRALVTMESDAARERYKKVRLRFAAEAPSLEQKPGILSARKDGRFVELVTNSFSQEWAAALEAALKPEELQIENLTLEEIFIAVAGRPANLE
ncbi:MAG: ABC transporter ATP-binding protein [Candidatus Sumerlaeota bacterium]|nr:ABC transporter ATP-binding protein [Candidatus Sumerlaeota bacterium]